MKRPSLDATDDKVLTARFGRVQCSVAILAITENSADCGVLAKYKVVFQYLLQLKHIQVNLDGAWGLMN